MIVKFCYQNEIHRCSEPPSIFEELSVFLKNMFKTNLPSEFNLYYVNSDKQEIPITSPEDYNKLKELDSTKPLKIVIVGKEAPKAEKNQPVESKDLKREGSEYEVIQQSSNVETQINQADEKLKGNLEDQDQDKNKYPELVDSISQDFTKVHVMPRLADFNPDVATQENVKRIVADILKEQVPYIISQVKDSLVRDGLISIPRNNEVHYGQNHSVAYNWNNMSNQPYQNYQNYQRPQVVEPRSIEQNRARPQNQEPSFFDNAIKALSSLPDKAAEVIDNFAQKVEGDPYVVVAEGKYFKSTIDKVDQLREIFPDEEKKKLLDFVQELPRAMTLDQLVNVYVSRGHAE